jgi:carboxyl-terminal processing protease
MLVVRKSALLKLPQLRPSRRTITNALSVVVLVIVAFWVGDALHGRVWNPLTPHSTNRLDFSSINDLYTLLQNNYDGQLDRQKLIDGARAGFVAAAGDPYTVYLTADQAKALNDDLGGKLSGIGAQIGIKNNAVTVIAPISDSPAEKAGLKAGDIIAQINGEDTSGMNVDTAVSKIRGKAGTTVTLKLIRGNATPIDLTITRADLTVPSVTWSMKNGTIGYIKITQFGTDTASLADKAATELKAQGAKKIILDLRNDGGGYLDAGISVASEFLPESKVVVSERTGGHTTSTNNSLGGGQLVGLPTIILVNGGSASASEIVAGALHDNNAARLVGEKTFGKGSVQQMKNLPGGAELKVTIAHWYTPAGININQAGIKPDVEVKLSTDDYNAGRDPQLDKALSLLQ